MFGASQPSGRPVHRKSAELPIPESSLDRLYRRGPRYDAHLNNHALLPLHRRRGTKTSAFAAHTGTGSRTVAVGNAGPSNLTFGLDECLAATREAVRNAIEALRNADPSAQIAFPYDGGVRFESVWAAYAGCTRQSDRDALLLPLQEMFGDVRLTGDGELLTAPAIGGPPHRFITLICGTGSLALLWDYNERAEQLARSGGWGPILDDAGSGWALGKEAIKSVLTFTANKFDLREWHCDILSHFGLHRTTGADRLISASSTLDPTKSPFEGDALRKKRIADCSRIVVKAAEGGDDEALRLLGVLADQVCSTLAPLVDVGKVREKETMIVVAGGLGQVQLFWRLVEDRFAKRGWRFRTIKMPEPGRSGLEALIK